MKRILSIVSVAAVLGAAVGALAAVASSASTQGPWKVCTGTCPTFSIATGTGEIAAEGDIEADGNLDIGGTATITGTSTFTGAPTFTGDATFNGGASAVTFGAASSTVVTTDNSATGLCMGSTGALATVCLDTRDAAEGWIVTGYETISSTLAVTGASTFNGGTVQGSPTIDTGTGQSLTTAKSGSLIVADASTDAVTTFVLPAATSKANYCFVITSSSLGSNRELDIATPAGSDLIIGTTTAAGGTGIVTTAGASHGVKNTHATAVRGNGTCLYANGATTWYMFGISGTWAAF